jgi:mannosyl-3-phosphoglycerate phosphatase
LTVESRHALIVSDVDGTLMDPRGHFPAPIGVLQARLGTSILVLASSRTVAELAHIQRRLRITGPMIAEDGGVLAWDEGWMDLDDGEPYSVGRRSLRRVTLGAPSIDVLNLVRPVAVELGIPFRTQGEHLLSESAATGKARREASARALERTHSLLIELEDPSQLEALRGALAALDVRVASGGRWVGMVRGSDKGRALGILTALMRTRESWHPLVVGIGDAANDVALLEACDLRFVVRGEAGVPDPRLVAVPGAVVLDRPGTAGWLEMLERVGKDARLEAS